jgi:hypothetical protein
MDKIVLGDYTVQDLLVLGGVIVGLLILVALLKKMFSKPKSDAYAQPVRCDQCGWQGKVSKYAGRCPRCNNPLGDRRVSQS